MTQADIELPAVSRAERSDRMRTYHFEECHKQPHGCGSVPVVREVRRPEPCSPVDRASHEAPRKLWENGSSGKSDPRIDLAVTLSARVDVA